MRYTYEMQSEIRPRCVRDVSEMCRAGIQGKIPPPFPPQTLPTLAVELAVTASVCGGNG